MIPGCFIIHPEPITDDRGWFSRVFCETEFESELGPVKFVQINHSFNSKKGTFRGMHFQQPPFSEGKLIRCIAGKVMDVALDVRKNSSTFLKSLKIELSAENRQIVFLPAGIAHGFQTLEDNSELIYHHTKKYNKESDAGVRFNDPLVNIELPLPISLISEKDRNYPLLSKEFKGIDI
jgi:dTDP-4-dehydrorhamnose 3,5-epimerase